MQFKKYSSIENHYRQKYIDKMLYHNPEARDAVWVAREKLDGANIQLLFAPNAEMRVGKRSQFISRDENFFDIWDVLPKYQEIFNKIQADCDKLDIWIRVYGEIYGPGINGRVDYGPEKKIAFFDAEDSMGLFPQWQFEALADSIGAKDLLPREFKRGTLDEVLTVDVEIGNCEGVVIKPWSTNFFLNDERFIIKKKAQLFLDKERGEGEPARENTSDIAYNINKVFLGYINENRVLDVIAKHGPITRMNQMGEYIKYVMEDAKADFLKDHDLATLIPGMTQKQEKMVFNVGGIVAGYLKRHLE